MPRSLLDFKKNDKSRSTFKKSSKQTEQELFSLQDEWLKDKDNKTILNKFLKTLFPYVKSIIIKNYLRSGTKFSSDVIETQTYDTINDFMILYYKKPNFKIKGSFGGLLYLKSLSVLYKDANKEKLTTSLDNILNNNSNNSDINHQNLKNYVDTSYNINISCYNNTNPVEDEVYRIQNVLDKFNEIIYKLINEQKISENFSGKIKRFIYCICGLYYLCIFNIDGYFKKYNRDFYNRILYIITSIKKTTQKRRI